MKVRNEDTPAGVNRCISKLQTGYSSGFIRRSDSLNNITMGFKPIVMLKTEPMMTRHLQKLHTFAPRQLVLWLKFPSTWQQVHYKKKRSL